MPWGSGARRKEGAQFACYRGPGRQPGSDFLDFDEWRGAARHAGLVEAARAATLAIGDVHQVTWHGVFGNGGRRYEKAVAKHSSHSPEDALATGWTWRRRSKSWRAVFPLAPGVPLLPLPLGRG